MTAREDRPGSAGGDDIPGPHHGGPDDDYTPERLAAMSREDLDRLGASYDGVEVLHVDPGPEPGSRLEKRAIRQVGVTFALAGLAAFAFVVIYVGSGWFLPDWHWTITEQGWSAFFTPLLGLLMGLSLALVGIGLVLYTKKLLPHETAVQDKHDGSHFDRVTTGATLVGGLHNSGLARRKLITRSLAFMGGGLGLMLLMPLGGLIKNPNKGNPLGTTEWAKGCGSSATTAAPSAPATRSPAPWRPSSRPFRGATSSRTPPRCSSGSVPSRSRSPAAPGAGRLRLRRVRRLLQDLHPRRLPGVAVRAGDQPHPLPLPPVAVRRHAGCEAGLRTGHAAAPAAAHHGRRRGLLRRPPRLH